MVLKGFKSFAKETEIQFINGMNVIVGPNGAGKSNIIDSLCFVLGRLSIKSIRAARAANLIFAGTKEIKPSHEASVKLVFDNSDKKFSISSNEIIIERIVRVNGQSIYKINDETKTRQEILELLSQAGIDPYGFNIILQGEIASIVKMSPEERRKVLEEVAGISIYELRKEKSLRELEKTAEKLKEVQSILRERTIYLNNLEEERKQALKYKKLEESIKELKASILSKKIEEKEKALILLEKNREEKEKVKNNLKAKAEKIQLLIEELEKNKQEINETIKLFSGIENEKLNTEIADIRADLSGLDVQKQSAEKRIQEAEMKIKKLNEEIKSKEIEIEKLRKNTPSDSMKYRDIEKKKKELDEAEKGRKLLYSLKAKVGSMKESFEDKKGMLQKTSNESGFLLKESENIARELDFKSIEECEKEILKTREVFAGLTKTLEEKELEHREGEKTIIARETEILSIEKVKLQVSKLDTCPLCKSKITPEHINNIGREAEEKIDGLKEIIKKIEEKKIALEIAKLKSSLSLSKNTLLSFENTPQKLKKIEEKKEQIKKLFLQQDSLNQVTMALEKEISSTEKKLLSLSDSEEKYEKLLIEIQAISSRSEESVNSELGVKERDMQAARFSIKQGEEEIEELKSELRRIDSSIEEKNLDFGKREKELEELEKKYQRFTEKKFKLEKEINAENIVVLGIKNSMSNVDNELNNLKVEKARISAEKQSLLIDFEAYKDAEIVSGSILVLEEKLTKTQFEFHNIGSVNLRALEVYEGIKKEYDLISEKVNVLDNEKLEIEKIIEEIDKKKKKTFMKTLYAINELFNRNFMQLLSKGEVFLELENEEGSFSAGLNIINKVGKGKYFDITSLSGGEKALVALSLLFAIQEYKPYSFYIFDEIDATLDKRNSEKLALLIKKHMKTGQYIIITHNDAIITESSVLYGVSMQEGVSKMVSLEI